MSESEMHNAAADPITVLHADLKRTSSESEYRSKCPRCPNGILLILRDRRGMLVREDACVACAQRFVYTDDTINNEPLVAAKDAAFPCPHARASWRSCPHCLGINDIVGEQPKVEVESITTTDSSETVTMTVSSAQSPSGPPGPTTGDE